ncbi:MAG: Ig-like domain-containing protein [Gemmatimonadaceae bacterium]
MTSAARFSARLSSFATVAAIAAFTACGGTTETKTPPVVKDVTPATVVPSATDTLRGVVGTSPGAVSVIVKNKSGELIDSAVVTFAIGSGGGIVGSSSVRTVSGQASTTWTLGQSVGLQTLTATVGGLTATFNAIASASTAAAITKVAGDLQTATIGANVTAPSVKITDKFGNPVPGALVTFSVTGGGGLVSGAAVNTGADGVATVGVWRLGTVAGLNTLTAGTGSLSVTFTATASPGVAATLTTTPTSVGELTLGQTVQFTVLAADASGNVISNPTVTWTSSNTAAATVSATGLVTAVGAGTAIITVSSGSVASTGVALSIIGHPSTTVLSAPISVAPGVPGDLAFTPTAIAVAVPGLSRVVFFDPTATVQTGQVSLTTPVQILVAPSAAAKPVVAINPSTSSRVWFIDPSGATGIDSADVPEFVKAAAITADGSRLYMMLSDGTMAVYDGNTHLSITRILLGGGVTAIKLAPGDTSLYAVTNVGVIFEIDTRTNSVKRQIIASVNSTDFVIGRDGLFYLLDATNRLVKIFNITTLTTVRTLAIGANPTSIAVTPDLKQIWIGYSANLISVFTGSVASGYISTADILTAGAAPIRVYISPTGSFAAITNFGGWIDIVR